jgi:cobalamin biosynthesis Mg chelatase CobN
MVMTAAELNGDWELLADTGAAVAYPQAEPALADLSDELIAFLSQAMDSELEVEITPEIMIDLNTTGTTDRLSPEVLEALDLFEASVSQELPSQELEGQAPAPTAVASPEAQVMAWLEPEADDGQATLTAAEVAAALESAAADETAGERAQPAPRPKTAAARKKEQVGRSNNANDTVPWVVAILIILIIAMLLGLVVYFAMFPNNLPIDLSLDLPQELPFLN